MRNNTVEVDYYCMDCDTTFIEDRHPDDPRMEIATHDCGKQCQKTDSADTQLRVSNEK